MEIIRGKRFAGRFRIRACLGTGTSGSLFLADDGATGDAPIALRITEPPPSHRARMMHLSRILTRLDHPNLTSTFGVFSDGGSLAVAREYVPGINLVTWLEHHQPTVFEALAIFAHTLAALMELGRSGLCHHALNSDNVLLDTDGTVKISDARGTLDDESKEPADAVDLRALGVLWKEVLERTELPPTRREMFLLRQLHILGRRLEPDAGRARITTVPALERALHTAIDASVYQIPAPIFFAVLGGLLIMFLMGLYSGCP